LIVVDTSALMAVLLDEPEAARCVKTMEATTRLLLSAGTLAEAMIVAGRHRARPALERLLARLRPDIVPVTAADARLAADAYDRWGKGVHPAGLNLGDCFAYGLATQRGSPLLFVGNDFSRTDVIAA
jgi:ribonuclease VapC